MSLHNIPILFSLILFSLHLHAALSHMGLDPPEVVAGSRTIITFRISHDCGDETIGTTNFTIELPPNLPSVSVEETSNWRAIIHKATLTSVSNPPISTVDSAEHEYIRAVTYIGFLPDGFYQLFNLRIHFPDEVGKVYWFKGYQDCHNQGESIAWATIPSASDPYPRYPARNITLIAPM